MGENMEFFRFKSIMLSDDILLILAKHYLREKDCMSLVFSGTSNHFKDLYCSNRKRLGISQCYFITPAPWKSFFQQHIDALLITSFDARHLYWLPAAVLLDSVCHMINLEELHINDTKISLKDLPQIFGVCSKLVKLSFSFEPENRKQYREPVLGKKSLDLLSQGFGKLTHLKMFVLNKSRCYLKCWLAILEVLKWCQVCTNLLIKIAYPSDTDYDSEGHILSVMKKEFLPHLNWMRSLKSLVILKPCDVREEGDICVVQLLEWLFCKKEYRNCRPLPVLLERFWYEDHSRTSSRFNPLLTENDLTCPSVKSLVFNSALPAGNDVSTLSQKQFHNLQHVGNVKFRRFDHLPNLKYIRGRNFPINKNNREHQLAGGLREFCESHSMLEHLHIDTKGEAVLQGDWKLLVLKVLAYEHCRPDKEEVTRMIEACPNIQELHIGSKFYLPASCKDRMNGTESSDRALDFFSRIKFHELTTLTYTGLCLKDGANFDHHLPSIVERCPKLERLHLTGCFAPDMLFSLKEPLARNLRDLRLEWGSAGRKLGKHPWLFWCDKCDESQILALLENLQETSPKLERLVLCYEGLERCKRNRNNPTELEDFIVNFVSKMENLVALYLAGFWEDPFGDEKAHLNWRLTGEILPIRPSFWFHLGFHLFGLAESKILPPAPWIHYDEIVNPTDRFYAPPPFE